MEMCRGRGAVTLEGHSDGTGGRPSPYTIQSRKQGSLQAGQFAQLQSVSQHSSSSCLLPVPSPFNGNGCWARRGVPACSDCDWGLLAP